MHALLRGAGSGAMHPPEPFCAYESASDRECFIFLALHRQGNILARLHIYFALSSTASCSCLLLRSMCCWRCGC